MFSIAIVNFYTAGRFLRPVGSKRAKLERPCVILHECCLAGGAEDGGNDVTHDLEDGLDFFVHNFVCF